MRGEVVAEYAAGISETIGILRRRGIEQNANGLLRLRTQDYDASKNLAGLTSVAVDVENTAGAVALGIHQDFVSHGVRDKRAIAGRQSVGDSSKRGIKIGMRHAPTFAGAAEVARPAAVDGFGQIRATRGHDRAAKLFLDATAE